MLDLKDVPTENLEGMYTTALKEERWDDADQIHNAMFERKKESPEENPVQDWQKGWFATRIKGCGPRIDGREN